MLKKTFRNTLAQAAFALLVLFQATQLAFAAPISYGDFSDIPPGGVMYLDVTEDSGTDDPPLYNEPSITANLLDFETSGFVSTTTGGPLDITDGQLNFTVMGAPGLGISSLAITEGGDYSFEGTGGAGTTVRASLIVEVDILEVNGLPVGGPLSVNGISTFSTDLATAGVGPGFWNNVAFLDFGPLLGPGNLVTKAEVVVDNQLITNSEADTLAFIAKKDFAVTPGEDPQPFVPEPTSVALLVLGMGMLTARPRLS